MRIFKAKLHKDNTHLNSIAYWIIQPGSPLKFKKKNLFNFWLPLFSMFLLFFFINWRNDNINEFHLTKSCRCILFVFTEDVLRDISHYFMDQGRNWLFTNCVPVFLQKMTGQLKPSDLIQTKLHLSFQTNKCQFWLVVQIHINILLQSFDTAHGHAINLGLWLVCLHLLPKSWSVK